jgi:N-acetylmuramoyl-L-alanine amidase
MTLSHPSPNFGPRANGLTPEMLVIHYTGMQSADEALARMCDSASEVSAHYMIDEEGRVFSLVDEANRAWHAGHGSWRGVSDINSRSIGIELVNPGHEFGYRAFPMAQMTALAELAHGILARWPIPPRNVVGHSDVAPLRKQDPGELFDWRWLAGQGVGFWPQPGKSDESVEAMLRGYGYGFEDEKATIIAFQRHFYPARLDGVVDDACKSLMAGLSN